MEQYQNNPNYPEDIPYWVKRIQQANSRNAKRTVAQTEKELRKLYAEQSDVLYNKILELFVKITEAQQSEDGKIYTNDLFLTNNYYLLIQYFNECAKVIGGQQLEITESALIRTYQYAQSVVEGFMPEGAIQNRFMVPQTINAEQAINQVWCLDGKEFSDRIWHSKELLVKDLGKTLADFTARGETPFVIAAGIKKRLDVDLYSAYRIARTETAHAQIKGQTDKYKQMGFSHGKWLATDPCDECASLDGKVFTLDEIQSMIPRHPNCECAFLLVV